MPRVKQDFTAGRRTRPMVLACLVRLDRLQIVAGSAPRKPPAIRGFKVVSDHFVRPQTTVQTYARCRQYNSVANGARIFWQYDRRKGWLKPSKVTLVGDDRCGLSRREVWEVIKHCPRNRLLLVELALDFDGETGVDHCFVKRHAIFGKSRPRPDRGGEGPLRYGTRSSGKLVRAYRKPAVNSYRVELEFHSGLLRPNQVREVSDLANLHRIICPTHFNFVAIRWPALRKYLARHQAGMHVLDGARDQAGSIHAVLGYLRRKGVNNVHRFRRPLRENLLVQDAVGRWAATFGEDFHGH